MTMTRLCRAAATSCLVGLLTSGGAAAQGVDPADNAVVRMGPLAWTPSLSIPSFGYDTNIFNEARAPRRDFTANVQPAVDAWLRLGRVRVTVRDLQATMLHLLGLEPYRFSYRYQGLNQRLIGPTDEGRIVKDILA